MTNKIMTNDEEKGLNVFQRNAKVVVILAVLAGSTSGVLGKMIEAPSLAIGFFRLAIALPFFLVPVLIRHQDQLQKICKKDFILAIVAGVFLFFHFFTWFVAVKHTTIASATVLMSLHPFMVAFASIVIFRNKVPWKAIAGIVIAVAGATLIAGIDFAGGAEAIFGDVLAFCAAIGLGGYFSIGSVVRNRMSASVYVAIVFGACFICFAIGILVTRTPLTGYAPSDYFWIIIMTTVCQFGAHASFNWSMGYVSSLYVSAWDTCEIVFASILAIFIFSEIPTLWQIVGGVIVIGGLLYYDFNERGN